MSRMLSKVFSSRWKPKNYHSLENLKYLHMVLVKNATVTNQNRNLLVETLRSISEIMIWGDQNDSSVFDFFLEKNMLSFFKKIMKQKSGESVCVQLLQTLNILFENISHETSLYFLLSNNHVNSIIVHKFDFSDEEVMAYYISFLKILSLKLNTSTVHLFYHDQNKDFPLLTEALKFFNHSESMVRTAVRTVTLSCFRVNDQASRAYLCDKVANIYFANLTHDLGKLVLEINELTYSQINNSSMDKLRDLCHEHLDYLSYIQDIYRLDFPRLSEILTKYLVSGLFLPLYLVPIAQQGVHHEAITSHENAEDKKSKPISLSVGLFLTSHVFHIVQFEPLIELLSRIVCSSHEELLQILNVKSLESWTPKLLNPRETIVEFFHRRTSGRLRDAAKTCTFEDSITGEISVTSMASLDVPVATEVASSSSNVSESESDFDFGSADQPSLDNSSNSLAANHVIKASLSDQNVDNLENTLVVSDMQHPNALTSSVSTPQMYSPALLPPSPVLKDPITAAVVDVIQSSGEESDTFPGPKYISLADRPFLSEIFYSLNCKRGKVDTKTGVTREDVNDQNCLLSVILLMAMFYNPNCNQNVLESIYLPTQRVKLKNQYNCNLFEYLLDILTLASSAEMRIRSVTVEMTCNLLRQIVVCDVDPADIKNATTQNQLDSNNPFRSSVTSSEYYFITDPHLASIESVKEQSCLYLRRFYKSEEMFLDLFEHELESTKNKRTIVSRVIQDAPIILPPVSTPLSGIAAHKRLPCGEMELTKQAMRCFFELRNLSLDLQNCVDNLLPLAKESDLVKDGDRLNLSNSDLLGCKVITKSSTEERFLVVGKYQLMFVEPDWSELGWGIVKFTGPLQNTEVTGCADDNHSLQLSMNRPVVPASAPMGSATHPQSSESMSSTPLFSARLKFDDHIRSGENEETSVMAARQRIMKGRHSARQAKMVSIMHILEFPQDYISSEMKKIPAYSSNMSLSAAAPLPYPSTSSSTSVLSLPVPLNGHALSTTSSGSNSSKSNRRFRRHPKTPKQTSNVQNTQHQPNLTEKRSREDVPGSACSKGQLSQDGVTERSNETESNQVTQVSPELEKEEHEEQRVTQSSADGSVGVSHEGDLRKRRETLTSLEAENLDLELSSHRTASRDAGWEGCEKIMAVFDGDRSNFPSQWVEDNKSHHVSEVTHSGSRAKVVAHSHKGPNTLLSLALKASTSPSQAQIASSRGSRFLGETKHDMRRKSNSFSQLPVEINFKKDKYQSIVQEDRKNPVDFVVSMIALQENDPMNSNHFGSQSERTTDGDVKLGNSALLNLMVDSETDNDNGSQYNSSSNIPISRSLSHSALIQLSQSGENNGDSMECQPDNVSIDNNNESTFHVADDTVNNSTWVPEHCSEDVA